MVSFALNHMTMPMASTIQVLDAAQAMGCVGVELRNDLKTPLFDGISADAVQSQAQEKGLRILALAEVYGFNDPSVDMRAAVAALAETAMACKAEAIALIPKIEAAPMQRGAQKARLKTALAALMPVLAPFEIKALIEPLGFANSSLRFKADALEVIDDLGAADQFGLIHDSFHHRLSGEIECFAAETDIVHISGISDPQPDMAAWADAHRGLVDQEDRLGTLAQIKTLLAGGYRGALSFEVFEPAIHNMNNPAQVVSDSIDFITSECGQMAA